ncbi:MAG: hypothetical protein HZC38_17615 [Chloroflexi bacterium]|nr:hypothetical protein [Chloroflexota bacterium]
MTIQAYRLEATIFKDGMLTLNNLPVKAGESIEVIILMQPHTPAKHPKPYSLRGLPLKYDKPFEPVGESDWGVVQ